MEKKKKHFWKKAAVVLFSGLLCGGVASGTLAAYSYVQYHKEEKAEDVSQKPGGKPLSGQQGNGTPQYTGDKDAEARVSSVYDVSVVWDNVIDRKSTRLNSSH